MFQFVPIASGRVTVCHGKQPGSIVFTPSLQVSVHLEEIYPEPSLLQAKHSELSPPFLLWEMLQSLHHLNAALGCTLSCSSVSFLWWGAQNWAQHSRCE